MARLLPLGSPVSMQRDIPYALMEIYGEHRKPITEIGKFRKPVRVSKAYKAPIEEFRRGVLEQEIKFIELFLKGIETSLVMNRVKEDYVDKVKAIRLVGSVFFRVHGKEINFYTITRNRIYNRKMEWRIFEIEDSIERTYRNFVFDFVIVPRLGRQDSDLIPSRFEKIFAK
ncbi:hypothetical protein ES705_05276 [subsurface metagenome]|nr:hypothetical protein [Clostridia bacterium]